MNNLTKMMLANRDREGGMRDRYGPENRRDSRGRYAPRNDGGYPDGGFMRMKNDGGWVVKPIEDNYEPEGRRDQEERYSPSGERTESRMKPYWENRMENNRYRMDETGGRMIGFNNEYRANESGSTRSYMPRNGGCEHDAHREMKMGGSENLESQNRLDQRTAVEWVNKMENADGSYGEHFTMEQAERILKNKGWECDPLEFWVAMNAVWSDGAATAKKYGVDKLEYWADRAKEFLTDKDAGPGKMAKYYKYIVKH